MGGFGLEYPFLSRCPPHFFNFVVSWSRSGFSTWCVDALRIRAANSQILVGETLSMSEHIVHVTDDSFESEVLKSSEPVLIDYWAEWCGPCKMIAPVLDEIASEYTGRLKVAKLNIDDNPNTPPRYGIRGIPTLMLFKNGEVEATKVGAVSKSQLVAFIDSNL